MKTINSIINLQKLKLMKTQPFNIKTLLIAAVMSTVIHTTNAQNIGISATGTPPNNSALLDVDASGLPANNKKGLLIPRVALTSATDVVTIPSPATSLLIYNTATAGSGINQVFPGFYYFDGTKWRRVIDDKYSVQMAIIDGQTFPPGGFPTYTFFKCNLTTVVVDNMGVADVANGRIVIQETGWYQITTNANFCPQTTHYTHTIIYLNGSPLWESSNASSIASGCRTNNHTFYAFLNSNDVLEFYLLDSQNGPTAGIDRTRVSIIKIH